MITVIACPCGHVGAMTDDRLPRELTCWRCGSSRLVEAGHGTAIVSHERFGEWLAGKRDEPRLRRKVGAR